MVDDDKQTQSGPRPPSNQRRRRASSTRPTSVVKPELPAPAPEPGRMHWYRIDLHIHTPASIDYQQSDITFLDILHEAEERDLDIVAFTDHNSVRGYADLWREIEDFELLESLGRLAVEERDRLAEYRRLLAKILLLPGFEFTATFGFHILAIFPERTTVRMMEHMLLTLGVPEGKFGSGEVGATTDVLRTYRLLSDAGALVIGAHVNSTHGIAMLGLNFGGQTKIAYTQDPHLHALEVTDLNLGNRARSTTRFFSGTKAEYPRRMHCIQGSDAHRLERDLTREGVFGVGERPTEALLPERSFQALKDLFLGVDFSRTRPVFPITSPADEVRLGRLHGNSPTQSFHEHLANKRSGTRAVLQDVAAFANTSGGTIFVGASTHERRPIAGIPVPSAAADSLRKDILAEITPPIDVNLEVIESGGKSVLAVRVPEGANKPYALAPGHIFVRRLDKSEIASRDEIVQMVRSSAAAPLPARARGNEASQRRPVRAPERPALEPPMPEAEVPLEQKLVSEHIGEPDAYEVAPSSGVEIVAVDESDDTSRLTIRDLRHRRVITRVNPDETRGVWRDAIDEWRNHSPGVSDFKWRGNYGVLKERPDGTNSGRYTLAWRSDGSLRVFYAVSEENLRGAWKSLVAPKKRTTTKNSATAAQNTQTSGQA